MTKGFLILAFSIVVPNFLSADTLDVDGAPKTYAAPANCMTSVASVGTFNGAHHLQHLEAMSYGARGLPRSISSFTNPNVNLSSSTSLPSYGHERMSRTIR